MLERETLQHSSIVKPHSLLVIAMLASLAGCGDSKKDTSPDAQKIEHDNEIARLERKWGKLAAEKELAEKTAVAETKRLAFERAKLEIERETFEAEKARLTKSNQPPAPPVAAPPVVDPAADIAKAEQERSKIEAEKMRVENDSATVLARANAEADEKAFPILAPAAPPVAQPVQPFASLPPKATPTPTPRPYERGSGKTPEKGLRPVKLQPPGGL